MLIMATEEMLKELANKAIKYKEILMWWTFLRGSWWTFLRGTFLRASQTPHRCSSILSVYEHCYSRHSYLNPVLEISHPGQNCSILIPLLVKCYSKMLEITEFTSDWIILFEDNFFFLSFFSPQNTTLSIAFGANRASVGFTMLNHVMSHRLMKSDQNSKCNTSGPFV